MRSARWRTKRSTSSLLGGGGIPYNLRMKHEFTAIIERDGGWFVGYCPEVPGANGQGESLEECRENLRRAIELILEDRREDGMRTVPLGALLETIKLG